MAAVRMQLGHSQMDSFLPTPDASHMGTRAMWRQRAGPWETQSDVICGEEPFAGAEGP